MLAVRTYPRCPACHKDLGPETLCLFDGAPREVAPAQALREAGIVLDARAVARLAARRLLLDNHRTQTFGRGVDSRREPCRPTTNDDQIIETGTRFSVESELLRDGADVRIDEKGTVREQHNGKLLDTGDSTIG